MQADWPFRSHLVPPAELGRIGCTQHRRRFVARPPTFPTATIGILSAQELFVEILHLATCRWREHTQFQPSFQQNHDPSSFNDTLCTASRGQAPTPPAAVGSYVRTMKGDSARLPSPACRSETLGRDSTAATPRRVSVLGRFSTTRVERLQGLRYLLHAKAMFLDCCVSDWLCRPHLNRSCARPAPHFRLAYRGFVVTREPSACPTETRVYRRTSSHCSESGSSDVCALFIRTMRLHVACTTACVSSVATLRGSPL